MKTRNLIILICLAIFLAGGIMAYRMWNKPHQKVENAEAVKISAETLSNAFTDNEQNANTSYLNKVIEVSGIVAEVTKNQDGKTVILLRSDDPLSGVLCTMREDNVAAQPAQQITIKGFCNGYTTAVLLSDCIIP